MMERWRTNLRTCSKKFLNNLMLKSSKVSQSSSNIWMRSLNKQQSNSLNKDNPLSQTISTTNQNMGKKINLIKNHNPKTGF